MHELEDHLIETWRKLLLERKLAKPDERPTLSKNIGMVQIGPDARYWLKYSTESTCLKLIQFIRRIGNARQEQDPQIADHRPKIWKRTVYFDA